MPRPSVVLFSMMLSLPFLFTACASHAAPPGANPFWLPNPPLKMAHLGAIMDIRILADIARRLRGEEPFTQFPATPLPESRRM